MASQKASGDAQALSVLHDMLRYVERELGFLDTPVPDARASVGQAAISIEGALRSRHGRRRASPR